MRGFLLQAILIGNMAIPIWAAREPTMRRSVRKAIFLAVLVNSFLAGGLRYVYWLIS
jgi:hypothetical protein